jgi:hypothetical protein
MMAFVIKSEKGNEPVTPLNKPYPYTRECAGAETDTRNEGE